MLELVVAVSDEGILDRNLLRSPLLKQPGVSVHLRKGFACAGKAYNSMLLNAKSDWPVFLHQDVFIPDNWQEKVHYAIRSLEETDPNWAILGVYGVNTQGQHVGHLWCSGCNKILGSHFELPEAVGSLDEVLLYSKKISRDFV